MALRKTFWGCLLVASSACAAKPQAAPAPSPVTPQTTPESAAPPGPPQGGDQEEVMEEATQNVEALQQRLLQQSVAAAAVPELILVERGPERPWLLAVVNRSQQAFTIQNDPSLLELRVQVPGTEPEAFCRRSRGTKLPTTASSKAATELLPGEALLYPFDVRSLCFRAQGDELLVPGSLVEARYGFETVVKTRWAKGKKETYIPPQKPPFVAAPRPAEGASEPPASKASTISDDQETHLKELRSAVVALNETYATGTLAATKGAPLILRISHGSDTTSKEGVRVGVSLENNTEEPLRLFFRRELVTFSVVGPTGPFECRPGPDARAPASQAFLTIPPGKRETFDNRMIELCPEGAFESVGLYSLTATLTATETGKGLGVDAFVGKVESVNTGRVLRLPAQRDPRDRMVKVRLSSDASHQTKEKADRH